MGQIRYTLLIPLSLEAGTGSFLIGDPGNTKLTQGGAAIAGHNGGRSQTGFNTIVNGDWPFINIMKQAPLPVFSDGSQNTVAPNLFNADGYPLATPLHSGLRWRPVMPTQFQRPGNYICTWDGAGTTLIGAGGSQLGTVTFTGSITGTTMTISGLAGGSIQPGQRVVGGTVLPYTFIMSGSGTTWQVSKSQSATGLTGANGGSNSSSGGAGAGFFACTIAAGQGSLGFDISTVGSPIITNVQIYHVDDAARVVAGETFGAEFLRRIREANFGVLRFMDWHANNDSNMTTWNTRKPVTAMTYQADQLNPNFYAGTATHTSNAYVSSQFPTIHSSDGTAWTSGGPKDRDTVHIVWANSATQSGTCSLSIGTSGVAINILNPWGGILDAPGYGGVFFPGSHSFRQNDLATLIYDAKFSAWIMHGGNAAFGNVGVKNGVPYEICVQLCKEVSAHPYFNVPYLSADPATNLVAELAQYCKTYAAANAPWMIPRFEGPNEVWNGNTFPTGIAGRKAVANWGTGDFHDQYGKWLANIGQMCAGVYGGGNLGVTYYVLCGVQTVAAIAANERLASSLYIAQAAAADPAVTGTFGTISFTKQAAKLTTSHIACTQYMSPLDRFKITELVNGFAYSVTNKGNSSAQVTIANTYCDGLLGPAGDYNLAKLSNDFQTIKTWAAGYGINKQCGYEGGWSPDYLTGQSPGVSGSTEADAWWSYVTGRVSANPAVIQLTTTCRSSEGAVVTGNPGVVGMAVTFANTGTAFDSPGMYARPVTFTAFSSTISGANTLVVNQAVYFRTSSNGVFPTGMGTPSLALTSSPTPVYTETFYVVAATGSTCQISAARGGTAITFTAVGTGGAGSASTPDGIYLQEAWFITSVDSVNNRVTLDCNSTGFSAPTTGTMSYCKSMLYSNNLRSAGKLAPNLQTHTITNYTNFAAASGEFPSNFLMAGPGFDPTVGSIWSSGNAWIVLEPLEQTPNPPQWLAFIQFNH